MVAYHFWLIVVTVMYIELLFKSLYKEDQLSLLAPPQFHETPQEIDNWPTDVHERASRKYLTNRYNE